MPMTSPRLLEMRLHPRTLRQAGACLLNGTGFMAFQSSDVDVAINAEVARRFAHTDFLTEAISKATRDAVLEHKRIGNPIAGWKDGKVVIIQPEDIEVPDVASP